MARAQNPAYGIAHTSVSSRGYAHIDIYVHDLFKSYGGASLKIGCQAGGSRDSMSYGTTYAWQHGLSHDGGVIGLSQAHEGYLLLRRLSRQLAVIQEKSLAPATFTDYAIRILIAAGVPKVHVKPASYIGSIRDLDTDLPTFKPKKQCDELRHALLEQERYILEAVA